MKTVAWSLALALRILTATNTCKNKNNNSRRNNIDINFRVGIDPGPVIKYVSTSLVTSKCAYNNSRNKEKDDNFLVGVETNPGPGISKDAKKLVEGLQQVLNTFIKVADSEKDDNDDRQRTSHRKDTRDDENYNEVKSTTRQERRFWDDNDDQKKTSHWEDTRDDENYNEEKRTTRQERRFWEEEPTESRELTQNSKHPKSGNITSNEKPSFAHKSAKTQYSDKVKNDPRRYNEKTQETNREMDGRKNDSHQDYTKDTNEEYDSNYLSDSRGRIRHREDQHTSYQKHKDNRRTPSTAERERKRTGEWSRTSFIKYWKLNTSNAKLLNKTTDEIANQIMCDFQPKGTGYENKIFEKFITSRSLGSREVAIRARSNSNKRPLSRKRPQSREGNVNYSSVKQYSTSPNWTKEAFIQNWELNDNNSKLLDSIEPKIAKEIMRDFQPKENGYESKIFEKFAQSRLLGSREAAVKERKQRSRSNSQKRSQSKENKQSKQANKSDNSSPVDVDNSTLNEATKTNINKEEHASGWINNKNSCYANSTARVLQNSILNVTAIPEDVPNRTGQLLKKIESVKKGNKECLENIIAKFWPMFPLNQQHDSDEILRMILNDIEFEGSSMQDALTCGKCKTNWTSKNDQDVTISIPVAKSIQKGLEEFLKPQLNNVEASSKEKAPVGSC